MRSIWQSLGRPLARDIALVCLADGLVGASFGAIAVAGGLPIWLPMLLSVVVFAGASQFMFVAIIVAGGSPIAALAAGLLVNARHLPFGLTIGGVLGRGWWRRFIGSHLMIDESVAFALAQQDPVRRRAAYWGCGSALFVCWNAGVVLGAFGGTAIGDTDAFGMDAAFPAVLLALMVPSLRDRATRLAAIVGAVIAVALGPVLPPGLPVLVALAAVPLTMLGRWRSEVDANTGAVTKPSGHQPADQVTEPPVHQSADPVTEPPVHQSVDRQADPAAGGTAGHPQQEIPRATAEPTR